MIVINTKWYRNEKQFSLIKELLDNRKIKNKILFSENRSVLIIESDMETYRQVCCDIIDPIWESCNGGTVEIYSGKVDLNKPICVTIMMDFPTTYHAELLPNYLNEKLHSCKIYKDGELYGFCKFNPENSINKSFIVSNILHSFCEQLHPKECMCKIYKKRINANQKSA